MLPALLISGLMGQPVEFVVCDLVGSPTLSCCTFMPRWPKRARNDFGTHQGGLSGGQGSGHKAWDVGTQQARYPKNCGAQANKAVSLERVEAIRWAIESALSRDVSLRKASDLFNARGVASPGGGRWHAPSLLKAARRLGLR